MLDPAFQLDVALVHRFRNARFMPLKRGVQGLQMSAPTRAAYARRPACAAALAPGNDCRMGVALGQRWKIALGIRADQTLDPKKD